jgi:hypothetical protein
MQSKKQSAIVVLMTSFWVKVILIPVHSATGLANRASWRQHFPPLTCAVVRRPVHPGPPARVHAFQDGHAEAVRAETGGYLGNAGR